MRLGGHKNEGQKLLTGRPIARDRLEQDSTGVIEERLFDVGTTTDRLEHNAELAESNGSSGVDTKFHRDTDRVVIDIRGDVPKVEIGLQNALGPSALLNAPGWQTSLKRVIDVFGASFGLIALSPLMLAVALTVKLSSRGPVIFRQTRVGKHSEEFEFLKFRSMRVGAERDRADLLDLNECDGPVFKMKDDPRMTWIGRVIRKASIDELPQLWNVLKGEMSLVGPRPPIPGEVLEYSEWQLQRLSVKPGITCIWQVSGRSELDFDTWVGMDIDYIQNWSLWLDTKLLAKTLPAVISGKGAY